MQCKLCKFAHSSREVLLKHYSFHHYQGRSWQQPCLYTDCICTFRTIVVTCGAYGDNMKTLLDQLDNQTSNVLAHRKATALKGLPLFMREKSEHFLKTCLDTEPEENHTKRMKMGILSIVEDNVATIHSDPNVRCLSVVLEEYIVLDNVQDLPTAMAVLFGLIYTLNMNYPKELKYTFETIQESSPSKTNC